MSTAIGSEPSIPLSTGIMLHELIKTSCTYHSRCHSVDHLGPQFAQELYLQHASPFHLDQIWIRTDKAKDTQMPIVLKPAVIHDRTLYYKNYIRIERQMGVEAVRKPEPGITPEFSHQTSKLSQQYSVVYNVEPYHRYSSLPYSCALTRVLLTMVAPH